MPGVYPQNAPASYDYDSGMVRLGDGGDELPREIRGNMEEAWTGGEQSTYASRPDLHARVPLRQLWHPWTQGSGSRCLSWRGYRAQVRLYLDPRKAWERAHRRGMDSDRVVA